jgi:MFS family permease
MKSIKAQLTPNKTLFLVVVALAQFIIIVDSTFMSVSISTLVVDLNTSVTAVQTAIALYTLVMASLMIAGAKIGDIFGRRKIFFVGLTIYATGTLIASLSPNIVTFILGWSFMEGIGAALMLPAMVALIAGNYPAGIERTKAYAVLAMVGSSAAAIGPIVGGIFTTYLSWRLAFFSELFVVAFIVLNRQIIKDAIYQGKAPSFDFKGFILTVTGFVSLVGGIILASYYGILYARTDVVVAGQTIITEGQLSPTVWLVLTGLSILTIFYFYEKSRLDKKLSVLIDVRLFAQRVVVAGSFTMFAQYLATASIIYSLALYLQMGLGYNAIQNGLTLLPLSIAVVIAALFGSKVLASRIAPRWVVMAGFGFMTLGAASMGLTARNATSGIDFALGIFLIGLGVGLIASQNQNLVISSVPNKFSSEISGVLNTCLNIGSSMGTALAGAIIITSFIFNFTTQVDGSTAFTDGQKTQINTAVNQQAQIVSNTTFESLVVTVPQPQQTDLVNINSQARQTALTRIYIVIGGIGIMGILASLLIPKTKPLDYLKNPKQFS